MSKQNLFANIMSYLLTILFLSGVFIGISSITDANWLKKLSKEDKYKEALTAKSYADNYRKSNKYNEAISAYVTALEINPEYGDAFQGLALTYMMMGDYHRATMWFKKSLLFEPLLPDISHGNIASVEQQLGNVDVAKYHYRKAIETAPDPTNHLISFASYYLELGQIDSLLIQITIAAEKYADIKSQYEAVLEFARRFRKQTDKTTEAIDSLLVVGIGDEHIQNFDVKLFEKHYKQQKRWMAIEHLTGIALTHTGRPKEAILHLENALKIQPSNSAIIADINTAKESLFYMTLNP